MTFLLVPVRIRTSAPHTLYPDPDWFSVTAAQQKVVFMVNSMTSRSGSEFPEPTRFLPERWLRCPAAAAAAPAAAAAAGPSPFASLPFSHGPRMCIGRRLSEHELLVFATRVRAGRTRSERDVWSHFLLVICLFLIQINNFVFGGESTRPICLLDNDNYASSILYY